MNRNRTLSEKKTHHATTVCGGAGKSQFPWSLSSWPANNTTKPFKRIYSMISKNSIENRFSHNITPTESTKKSLWAYLFFNREPSKASQRASKPSFSFGPLLLLFLCCAAAVGCCCRCCWVNRKWFIVGFFVFSSFITLVVSLLFPLVWWEGGGMSGWRRRRFNWPAFLWFQRI